MKRKILFRADGDDISGLGHLYRLFSLVEMLKNNFDFIFLTKETTVLSVFPDMIDPFLIPESISIENEPSWLVQNFSPQKYMIIADGYQFNATYQKDITSKEYVLIYIDDLIKEHMFADIVINHSPGLNEQDYNKEGKTNLVLGTEYALLRPSFLKLAIEHRSVSKIDTVFICFGGADPYNLTIKAMKACFYIEKIKTIHVVVGGANNNEEIEILTNQTTKEVHIYRNISEKEMVKIMCNSSIAIAPSSTILYELCCVKIPVLSGYFVDNQQRIYHGFLKENAIIGLGNIRSFTEENFRESLISAIEKDDFQDQLIAQGRLFDSKIQERYVRLIDNLC